MRTQADKSDDLIKHLIYREHVNCIEHQSIMFRRCSFNFGSFYYVLEESTGRLYFWKATL